MNPAFQSLTEQLEAKFRLLMNAVPVAAEDIPDVTPIGGVYLFSENGIYLYTGRTKRKLSRRIRDHFSTALDCPFAWQMAREITGRRATYKKLGSRKDLLSQPDFRRIYDESKQRIRKMHVQYVEESEPLRQALLEIYAAVVTNSLHNDFDTH
jgi:hypothetical protein